MLPAPKRGWTLPLVAIQPNALVRETTGVVLLDVVHQPALRIWKRHAQRRRDGLPTISLIVGTSEDIAGQRTVLARAGFILLTSQASASAEMCQDWLNALADLYDPLDCAFAFVAQQLSMPQSELRASWAARSDWERQLWLSQRASGAALPLRAALESLRAALDVELPAETQLAQLLEFLPDRERLALCLLTHGPGGLCALLALANARLDWPLLAIVEHAAWSSIRDQLDDRSRAQLDVGVLPTPPLAAAQTSQVEQVPDLQARAAEAVVRAERARRSDAPDARDLALRARSLAELRLYELLQAEPVTRDLFELNRLLPFSFGPRAAEIDLACVSLRLAIEVDGYHHFRELDGYRRDRRKDVVLQHQGYLVSRYLASDVIERAAEVVRSIRDLVLRRKRSLRRENGA